MANTTAVRATGLALGIVLSVPACASGGHGIAVLDSESSTQPVPEVLRSNERFADDSARYLGRIDGYSYFAARPASGAEDDACLVQVGAPDEDWIGGCATIQSDRVVELSGGASGQEIALVRDDPSAEALEDAGWVQRADNLWQRSG